jgi:hypothetical protein
MSPPALVAHRGKDRLSDQEWSAQVGVAYVSGSVLDAANSSRIYTDRPGRTLSKASHVRAAANPRVAAAWRSVPTPVINTTSSCKRSRVMRFFSAMALSVELCIWASGTSSVADMHLLS